MSTDPTHPPLDTDRWQARLDTLRETYGVPGATLGVLRTGSDDPVGGPAITALGSGVLHNVSGAPVGPDSVFQFGSITKVWTATMVMQLVERGLLDLDAPVSTYLPDWRLRDPETREKVTLRHLLTHTSGIDGDLFIDTGRGDDCLERYLDVVADATQTHRLGATFSYCNSGFSLAGRIIETVTGQVWDAALRDLLLTPLGLTRTGTLPEEALLHDAACGHATDADGATTPVTAWALPRSAGPAGLIHGSVTELLTFVAAHLRSASGQDGIPSLGPDAVREMTAEQVRLPGPYDACDSWGLGWCRYDLGGVAGVGHNGATIGQTAYLRVIPSEGLAVTMLTNGGRGAELFRALFGELLAELSAARLPELREPVAGRFDATAYQGTYARAAERIEVRAGDAPTLRTEDLEHFTDQDVPVEEFTLEPYDATTALVRSEDAELWSPVMFYEVDGRRYVHKVLRATPEVDPGA